MATIATFDDNTNAGNSVDLAHVHLPTDTHRPLDVVHYLWAPQQSKLHRYRDLATEVVANLSGHYFHNHNKIHNHIHLK
jgi:hypothetical protein